MLYLRIFILVIFILSPALSFAEPQPITTDRRIKTYVYNESEVFPIRVHYGYQSFIEFGEEERIEAYSLGNALPWKITSVKNRLFLTPLDGYSHTNMTVITDTRTYQFDIESIIPKEDMDPNLTYTVRFYYPDDGFDRVELTGSPEQHSRIEVPLSVDKPYNFSYSYVGPDQLAPTKVFDDGVSTYFELPLLNMPPPSITAIDFSGKEINVNVRRHGRYFVVDRIAGQFAVRYGYDLICIFNENNYSKGQ